MKPAPPVRVAHILPFGGVGGTEIATLRLARAASQVGFDNEFFYREDAPEIAAWLTRERLVGTPYTPPQPSLRHGIAWWKASRYLAGEFRRRGIGLVHCSDIGSAYTAGLAGKLAGVPVLSHVRNRYETLPWRERTPLRLTDHFAFVSRDTWRRFALPVPPSNATVLYDGMDSVPASQAERQNARKRLIEEFQLPPESQLFGMVARIAPQKDFQTLIAAARPLVARYPQARFVMIGEYSGHAAYREHYEQVRGWLEEAQLSPYFVFTDFRSNVTELLSALDIFVLCTNWEGFPLVILEAMAQGLPVVATAVDGIPEIVEEGVTGLLHPHRGVAELSVQMDRLLGDEELRVRLASAGQQLVATRFSRQAFQNSVENLYRRLLG